MIDFAPPALSVTGKLRHVADIQRADFEFLKSVTTQTPKVTIPSPTMVHFRGGRKTIDIHAYPEMDEFFAIWRSATATKSTRCTAPAAATCSWTTPISPICAIRSSARARASAASIPIICPAIMRRSSTRSSTAARNITVAVHLCRGNFKSAWVAEGGYEPVAEVLFNELNVDGYFLEYDDERAGDFRPLRFVPKHKTVVLGLVTTKAGALEARDGLITRIKEAAQFMPLENMCLSPQCGFSSTVEGNQISEEEQWAKVRLIVNVAREVWGD